MTGFELIWAGFMLGLLGSAHCAGMCGPIALALPGNQAKRSLWITGRLLYNSGRIVTYGLMGAVLGIFGEGLAIAGYQQMLSIGTGVILVMIALLPKSIFNRFLHKVPSLFGSSLSGVFARLMKSDSLASLFGIGLLNGLLPCGFVYMGLAGSLALGSISGSALFMILFGLGTFPVMLTMSVATGLFGLTLHSKMQRVLPYAVVVIGALLILRGLSLGIPFFSPVLDTEIQTTGATCH